MPTITRRRLLAGGLAVTALAAGGAAAVVLTSDDDAGDGDGPGTGPASPGSATEAVAAVGTAYLATHPDDADEARLRTDLPTLTGTSADEVVDQFPTLAGAVHDDFAADRTTEVDGWVLATTEARAAALVSLLA